jgi:hypothetical protein
LETVGQFADGCRYIRTGPHLRHDFLDVTLAPMARSGQQVQVIRGREVRREQRDRRQREIATFQHLEHNGEPAGDTGRLDATVCRVLGQMEHARAVHKERRASLTTIEPPRIDLCESRNQARGGAPLVAGEADDLIQ